MKKIYFFKILLLLASMSGYAGINQDSVIYACLEFMGEDTASQVTLTTTPADGVIQTDNMLYRDGNWLTWRSKVVEFDESFSIKLETNQNFIGIFRGEYSMVNDSLTDYKEYFTFGGGNPVLNRKLERTELSGDTLIHIFSANESDEWTVVNINKELHNDSVDYQIKTRRNSETGVMDTLFLSHYKNDKVVQTYNYWEEEGMEFPYITKLVGAHTPDMSIEKFYRTQDGVWQLFDIKTTIYDREGKDSLKTWRPIYNDYNISDYFVYEYFSDTSRLERRFEGIISDETEIQNRYEVRNGKNELVQERVFEDYEADGMNLVLSLTSEYYPDGKLKIKTDSLFNGEGFESATSMMYEYKPGEKIEYIWNPGTSSYEPRTREIAWYSIFSDVHEKRVSYYWDSSAEKWTIGPDLIWWGDECDVYQSLSDVPVDAGEQVISGVDVSAGPRAVSIYPNPVKDVLHISGLAENSTIQIYNLSGSLLVDLPDSSNGINVSHLESGVYFINVSNHLVGRKTLKFIKN